MSRHSCLLALLSACSGDQAVDPSIEHCTSRAPVDPRDATMIGEIVEIVIDPSDPSKKDLQVPSEMRAWMEEHAWPQIHDDWHNVRLVDTLCGRANAPEDCDEYARLTSLGLYRAPVQQGAPGNSFEFLVMHRHMIRQLREAFPTHAAILEGFDHVPLAADDPANTTPWRPLKWTAASREAIDVLEHIDDHPERFATEDDLGAYYQAISHWTPSNPSVRDPDPAWGGLHQAMHSQWAVGGSPISLFRGPQVIFNVSFWRLHGWIDTVWERYRVRMGLTDADPMFVETARAQCEEMHALDLREHGH
jgi:hypothetical protein